MTALPSTDDAHDSRQVEPPKKRARTDQVAHPEASTSSSHRLFAPFRALGLVTNHIPFALQTRSYKGATEGPRIHILTCLGRSWALWDGTKMTLLFIGTETPDPITSLLLDGDFVWASAGTHLIKYKRGKQVQRFSNPLETGLCSPIVFGEHIICLTEDGTRLLAWSILSGDLVATIAFPSDFTATHILHPATYLNKILVASSQGGLQLWNIGTKKLIHSFSPTRLADTPSPITCLVQSPAIDVVAIGFASGEISVYDIRMDERLLRMFQEGGPVRSLSFRGDGEGVLASASSVGHITLWDLTNGGRLLHVLRGAHDAAVSKIEWIPGQPVLVSSGEDNSVKQWFFESPTAPPRLLRFRSGHFAPPHLVRYYGEDGKALLTASRDRSLRYTSVVRDSRSTELSQGHLAKKAAHLSIPIASLKFAPVTGLSFSTSRSKDWDDVLTCHAEESFARTWSVQNKRHGKYQLAVHGDTGHKKQVPQGTVRAVHVTACGNFGLAANSKGVVAMWNLQSGIKRKTFQLPPPPPDCAPLFRDGKKDRVVIGVATDALNRVVIVATMDGTINSFDFHNSKLQSTMSISTTLSSILLQRDSGLLAVVGDDFIIRIIDIETQKIVRELGGFGGRILDIDFSADSRWLIACSIDSVIRTFDIPSGRLIDAFKTASVPTSLAMSPTGDFLATAHADQLGVYLWANRSQYSDVSFRDLQSTTTDLRAVDLPGLEDIVEDDLVLDLDALRLDKKEEDVFSSPDQLDSELVTLTLLPRARWQTLMNLDIIQIRNKPKEPPKAPERAPFFLPTLPGVNVRFDVDKTASALSEKEKAKQKKTKKLTTAAATKARSQFQTKLDEEDSGGLYDGFFDFLKTMTPAAIDLELRSLVDLDDIALFLHALSQRLKSRRDFEAVQAFISVFLRIHGEVVIRNEELEEPLKELLETQKEESQRILELTASSLGTLGFVRDTD